jgi:hypothetical protein
VQKRVESNRKRYETNIEDGQPGNRRGSTLAEKLQVILQSFNENDDARFQQFCDMTRTSSTKVGALYIEATNNLAGKLSSRDPGQLKVLIGEMMSELTDGPTLNDGLAWVQRRVTLEAPLVFKAGMEIPELVQMQCMNLLDLQELMK